MLMIPSDLQFEYRGFVGHFFQNQTLILHMIQRKMSYKGEFRRKTRCFVKQMLAWEELAVKMDLPLHWIHHTGKVINAARTPDWMTLIIWQFFGDQSLDFDCSYIKNSKLQPKKSKD
ncbi:hypothetical protein DKX38_016054 [Salix brachista]|uniref:Uncharacterized protein n=1 Tax=Salix brachista TaxID=2182728 RepID=A0A5N5L8Z5_9ROSI|nr:hypothetical protein DKX38_016054 [Salix brachista]